MRAARLAFMVSLIGIVVQFGWVFAPYQGLAKLGASAVAFPAFITAICIGEIGFAGLALKRGWLS